MSADRITATYRVRCPAAMIESRADAIALEQSVELPTAPLIFVKTNNSICGDGDTIRCDPTGPIPEQIIWRA